MKTEIETAIKTLTDQIKPDMKADDALKFTQAALNLAHVLATLALVPSANPSPPTVPATQPSA